MKNYFLKYTLITLCFIFLSSGNISAQQLTPFVVSSSGGFYNNTSGMLSFTTSEMTSIETYISPSAILTQGFQQSYELGTSVTEYQGQNLTFGIYPNPTAGKFILVTEGDLNEQIKVKILDLLGREILQTEFYHQGKINMHSLDLTDDAPGMYIILIDVREKNASAPTYQVIKKIQIVK